MLMFIALNNSLVNYRIILGNWNMQIECINLLSFYCSKTNEQ